MFPELVIMILGAVLIFSALGVLLTKNPVHSSLSFLLTLLALAALYLQLSAQFIAVMQVLVYAGAILVIFMFVVILFQDAYRQIALHAAKSSFTFIATVAVGFLITFGILGYRFINLTKSSSALPEGFGTVQSLGMSLYLDFFFPFEAVILLFLIAVVGAVYIGKKVT